ncbi:Microprocessor complex subunit DGCR8 [Orchesella cincta]|uniref:Microprocessor complex subunit DGCR8 n=1 Tax=Orchesella cincta TaxID=48709 RepID=A0A1D2MS32_ORCCI|nr:Microprocessor complex subunit DGCR8 [Orchesella cincta]
MDTEAPDPDDQIQQPDSNLSEKISAESSDDDDVEDNINGEQVDESSEIPFDGEEKICETEKDAEIEQPENDNYSDVYTDDEESCDEEMDESEIDSMLEQGLQKSRRLDKKQVDGESAKSSPGGAKPNEGNSELTIKKIVVLEEKGGNTFEVLPGGWIQVRHSSGMPLYLHRKTRVCTLSKPYFLGPASVRRHLIPLSGIPCLSYRRALAKEQLDKEMLEKQTKDFEEQDGKSSTSDKPEAMVIEVENEAGATTAETKKKCPNAETIAEKVKLFKRKLDQEKENAERAKREKLDENASASQENMDTEAASEVSTVTGSPQTSETDLVNPVTTNGNESATTEDPKAKNGNKTTVPKVKEFYSKALTIPALAKACKAKQNEATSHPARALIPLAKVETARENASLYSVSSLDLREYCKPLFKFIEIECKRFKTWSARRRHTKEQKRRQLERPTLPDNAQVIKFFDLHASKGGDEQMVKKFNDYVFNPNGKSSVCILHEFVQHALRKQPTYSFQELENAATPYSATVMINEIPYGRGYGSSKKTAKAEAAKATLEILIPQMKGQLNGNKADTSNDFDITEYFQQVEMNDVRIPKMCTSVSEPSPYTLLLTCLQRNFGQSGSSNVKFEMIPASPSKGNPPNQFRMMAGNDEVVVTASNKREGKQLASQLLLSKIHPHITNFGAFIKMYGNGSIKSVKEKKQEEQQITTLQSKASANSPNWAILNKLRQEMIKLAELEDEAKGISSSLNTSEKITSESTVSASEVEVS